jgi:AcrR family transcriptional regulator
MDQKSKAEPRTERIRDKASKIDLIKRTAKHLAEEHDFFEITNHGIAHDAGISIGLLYKYFPHGKLDIFHALVQDESQPYEQMQVQELKDITLDNYKQKLMDLLKIFYQFHLVIKNYIRTIDIARLSDPDLFADLGGLSIDLRSALPVLEKFQEMGLIPESMTRDQILLYLNAVDQVIHQYLFFPIYPIQSDEEFFEYLSNLCIKLFEIKPPGPDQGI